MTEKTYGNFELKKLYEKVVEEPNKGSLNRGFIECPVCGEKILMIPTLRVMGEAIEKHTRKHKEQLKADPIKGHETAILVRLSLMTQVLQRACKLQAS